ncbi:MAG: plsY [Panacagrimonas sp.]|jgi:glycerol-3-phosphate acyltransferase PlsY|nr:glycerol-3-phosphate 1-O-acyltransferase PlsY [Panacagrimonas sp.]MCC2657501.1 plsY [Panacagrimonas sp.]
MLDVLLKAALAYLLGNVMGGHLVGKLRGVDLGRVGSGNIGATNALRTQGTGFALLVLAIDVGKGVLGALAIPALPISFGTPALDRESLGYVCGAAVTVGHCYPALWKFRGGKGVATLAGVYGALLPFALPWMLLAFVLVVMLSGYVSLATLFAAAVAGLYVACFDARGALSAAGAFTAFMAALVVFKHRENIGRLVAGNESRFEKLRVIGRWLDR